MINTEIEKLQGRFTDDENKIVKELLKSLIQAKMVDISIYYRSICCWS